LLCGAHNAAGDRFPMVMEMKRMAPGCTRVGCTEMGSKILEHI
jgi:hypothetical protein